MFLACTCSNCQKDLKDVVAHLEQLMESNSRVVNELCKDMSEHKNAIFSLLHKLFAAENERSTQFANLESRQQNLTKVVKKMKQERENPEKEEALLALTRQVAQLQDTMTKQLSRLPK